MPSTRPIMDQNKITTNMLKIMLNIVEELKKEPSGIKFKEALQTYLLANDENGTLHKSHRYWAGHTGWPLTLLVLKAMRAVISHRGIGQRLWKSFILAEVSACINDVNLMSLVFIKPNDVFMFGRPSA